jgi:hypothetical protein
VINTKSNQDQGSIEICDLDALVDTSLSFRLHSNVHKLLPVSNIVFLRFVNGLSKIQQDVNNKQIGAEEFQAEMLSLFQSVCPTITKQDLENNTQAQTAALFSLIIDHVQGRTADDKKKMMKH